MEPHDALGWTSWRFKYNYDYPITDYNSNWLSTFAISAFTYNRLLPRKLRAQLLPRALSPGFPFNASTDVPGTSLLHHVPGCFQGLVRQLRDCVTFLQPPTITMPATNTVPCRWRLLTATATLTLRMAPVNCRSLPMETQPSLFDPVREGYTFAGWILYTNGNPCIQLLRSSYGRHYSAPQPSWKMILRSPTRSFIRQMIWPDSSHHNWDCPLVSAGFRRSRIAETIKLCRRFSLYVLDENVEVITSWPLHIVRSRSRYTVHTLTRFSEQIHSDDVIGSRFFVTAVNVFCSWLRCQGDGTDISLQTSLSTRSTAKEPWDPSSSGPTKCKSAPAWDWACFKRDLLALSRPRSFLWNFLVLCRRWEPKMNRKSQCTTTQPVPGCLRILEVSQAGAALAIQSVKPIFNWANNVKFNFCYVNDLPPSL